MQILIKNDHFFHTNSGLISVEVNPQDTILNVKNKIYEAVNKNSNSIKIQLIEIQLKTGDGKILPDNSTVSQCGLLEGATLDFERVLYTSGTFPQGSEKKAELQNQKERLTHFQAQAERLKELYNILFQHQYPYQAKAMEELEFFIKSLQKNINSLDSISTDNDPGQLKFQNNEEYCQKKINDFMSLFLTDWYHFLENLPAKNFLPLIKVQIDSVNSLNDRLRILEEDSLEYFQENNIQICNHIPVIQDFIPNITDIPDSKNGESTSLSDFEEQVKFVEAFFEGKKNQMNEIKSFNMQKRKKEETELDEKNYKKLRGEFEVQLEKIHKKIRELFTKENIPHVSPHFSLPITSLSEAEEKGKTREELIKIYLSKKQQIEKYGEVVQSFIQIYREYNQFINLNLQGKVIGTFEDLKEVLSGGIRSIVENPEYKKLNQLDKEYTDALGFFEEKISRKIKKYHSNHLESSPLFQNIQKKQSEVFSKAKGLQTKMGLSTTNLAKGATSIPAVIITTLSNKIEPKEYQEMIGFAKETSSVSKEDIDKEIKRITKLMQEEEQHAFDNQKNLREYMKKIIETGKWIQQNSLEYIIDVFENTNHLMRNLLNLLEQKDFKYNVENTIYNISQKEIPACEAQAKLYLDALEKIQTSIKEDRAIHVQSSKDKFSEAQKKLRTMIDNLKENAEGVLPQALNQLPFLKAIDENKYTTIKSLNEAYQKQTQLINNFIKFNFDHPRQRFQYIGSSNVMSDFQVYLPALPNVNKILQFLGEERKTTFQKEILDIKTFESPIRKGIVFCFPENLKNITQACQQDIQKLIESYQKKQSAYIKLNSKIEELAKLQKEIQKSYDPEYQNEFLKNFGQSNEAIEKTIAELKKIPYKFSEIIDTSNSGINTKCLAEFEPELIEALIKAKDLFSNIPDLSSEEIEEEWQNITQSQANYHQQALEKQKALRERLHVINTSVKKFTEVKNLDDRLFERLWEESNRIRKKLGLNTFALIHTFMSDKPTCLSFDFKDDTIFKMTDADKNELDQLLTAYESSLNEAHNSQESQRQEYLKNSKKHYDDAVTSLEEEIKQIKSIADGRFAQFKVDDKYFYPISISQDKNMLKKIYEQNGNELKMLVSALQEARTHYTAMARFYNSDSTSAISTLDQFVDKIRKINSELSKALKNLLNCCDGLINTYNSNKKGLTKKLKEIKQIHGLDLHSTLIGTYEVEIQRIEGFKDELLKKCTQEKRFYRDPYVLLSAWEWTIDAGKYNEIKNHILHQISANDALDKEIESLEQKVQEKQREEQEAQEKRRKDEQDRKEKQRRDEEEKKRQQEKQKQDRLEEVKQKNLQVLTQFNSLAAQIRETTKTESGASLQLDDKTEITFSANETIDAKIARFEKSTQEISKETAALQTRQFEKEKSRQEAEKQAKKEAEAKAKREAEESKRRAEEAETLAKREEEKRIKKEEEARLKKEKIQKALSNALVCNANAKKTYVETIKAVKATKGLETFKGDATILKEGSEKIQSIKNNNNLDDDARCEAMTQVYNEFAQKMEAAAAEARTQHKVFTSHQAIQSTLLPDALNESAETEINIETLKHKNTQKQKHLIGELNTLKTTFDAIEKNYLTQQKLLNEKEKTLQGLNSPDLHVKTLAALGPGDPESDYKKVKSHVEEVLIQIQQYKNLFNGLDQNNITHWDIQTLTSIKTEQANIKNMHKSADEINRESKKVLENIEKYIEKYQEIGVAEIAEKQRLQKEEAEKQKAEEKRLKAVGQYQSFLHTKAAEIKKCRDALNQIKASAPAKVFEEEEKIVLAAENALAQQQKALETDSRSLNQEKINTLTETLDQKINGANSRKAQWNNITKAKEALAKAEREYQDRTGQTYSAQPAKQAAQTAQEYLKQLTDDASAVARDIENAIEMKQKALQAESEQLSRKIQDYLSALEEHNKALNNSKDKITGLKTQNKKVNEQLTIIDKKIMSNTQLSKNLKTTLESLAEKITVEDVKKHYPGENQPAIFAQVLAYEESFKKLSTEIETLVKAVDAGVNDFKKSKEQYIRELKELLAADKQSRVDTESNKESQSKKVYAKDSEEEANQLFKNASTIFKEPLLREFTEEEKNKLIAIRKKLKIPTRFHIQALTETVLEEAIAALGNDEQMLEIGTIKQLLLEYQQIVTEAKLRIVYPAEMTTINDNLQSQLKTLLKFAGENEEEKNKYKPYVDEAEKIKKTMEITKGTGLLVFIAKIIPDSAFTDSIQDELPLKERKKVKQDEFSRQARLLEAKVSSTVIYYKILSSINESELSEIKKNQLKISLKKEFDEVLEEFEKSVSGQSTIESIAGMMKTIEDDITKQISEKLEQEKSKRPEKQKTRQATKERESQNLAKKEPEFNEKADKERKAQEEPQHKLAEKEEKTKLNVYPELILRIERIIKESLRLLDELNLGNYSGKNEKKKKLRDDMLKSWALLVSLENTDKNEKIKNNLFNLKVNFEPASRSTEKGFYAFLNYSPEDIKFLKLFIGETLLDVNIKLSRGDDYTLVRISSEKMEEIKGAIKSGSDNVNSMVEKYDLLYGEKIQPEKIKAMADSLIDKLNKEEYGLGRHVLETIGYEANLSFDELDQKKSVSNRSAFFFGKPVSVSVSGLLTQCESNNKALSEELASRKSQYENVKEIYAKNYATRITVSGKKPRARFFGCS